MLLGPADWEDDGATLEVWAALELVLACAEEEVDVDVDVDVDVEVLVGGGVEEVVLVVDGAA